MKKIRCLALLAVLLGGLCLALPTAHSQTGAIDDEAAVDRQFLSALRERLLFQTAEAYCRRGLSRGDISQRRQVGLLVQYLICLQEHAESLAPPRRNELWESAVAAAQPVVASRAAGDDACLAVLQLAIFRISQGRLLRQEFELLGAARGSRTGESADDPLEKARRPLREAIRDLRELEQTAAARLQAFANSATSSQSSPSGGAWDENAWLGFEKTVQFQLDVAAVELALTNRPDSPDRAAALTEAEQRLQVLAQLPPDHPLAFESRLAFARVCRLLHRWELAQSVLADIESATIPPQAALRARTERLRLALDAEDFATVEALLAQDRQVQGKTLPEYDLALLEAYWVLRNRAEKQGLPTEPWNLKIQATLEAIRKDGLPYWVRRAEMFIASKGAATPGKDYAMTAIAAETAYRAGRIDDALAAYDRARALAAKKGADDEAFRFGLTAAAIASSRGNHAEAYRRFAELADQASDASQSADARLMAIHHLGQLVQADSQQYLATFTASLQQFLSRHPDHPQAPTLRLRLAQTLELQGKLAEAAEAYWDMVLRLPGPAESQEADAGTQRMLALEGFGRCTERQFSSWKVPGQHADDVAKAAQRLGDWITRARSAGSDHAVIRDPAVRQAIYLSAWWRLLFRLSLPSVAKDLQGAIAEAEAAQLSPRDYADLVVLHEMAQLVLGESAVPSFHPESWDANTLRRLAERGDALLSTIPDQTVKRKLAEFLLWLTDALEAERQTGNATEQHALLELRARWLTLAERWDAALQTYSELAEELPNRGDIQEAMVLLLTRKGDAASLESALIRLRELARHSPEGSPRWFRVKYLTAWCLARLNRTRQAAELIAVLEALHPDLGGTETRERFLQLKRQCASARQ